MKKFQKTIQKQYQGTKAGFFQGRTVGFYTQKFHHSLFGLSDQSPTFLVV